MQTTVRGLTTDRKHSMPSETLKSGSHTLADPNSRQSGKGAPNIIVGAKATGRHQFNSLERGRKLLCHRPRYKKMGGARWKMMGLDQV